MPSPGCDHTDSVPRSLEKARTRSAVAISRPPSSSGSVADGRADRAGNSSPSASNPDRGEPVRIPLPEFLEGCALLREWKHLDGRLRRRLDRGRSVASRECSPSIHGTSSRSSTPRTNRSLVSPKTWVNAAAIQRGLGEELEIRDTQSLAASEPFLSARMRR